MLSNDWEYYIDYEDEFLSLWRLEQQVIQTRNIEGLPNSNETINNLNEININYNQVSDNYETDNIKIDGKYMYAIAGKKVIISDISN